MKISTSILSSNDRVRCVERLNDTASHYIHVDVMDGKFVENCQFSMDEIRKINEVSLKKLDIHLMVENPFLYIQEFDGMNIEYVSFHVEIEHNIKEIIQKIHELGYKAGLAISPNTDIDKLVPYLNMIDLILVMSVEPGKGGQDFIFDTIDKVMAIERMILGRNILIEVDGGINGDTVSLISNVDIVVSGSYIVNSDNYQRSIISLLSKCLCNNGM